MNITTFKDTLNLPVTDFPMKGNLPVTEKGILEKWESAGLYGQVREKSKGKKLFCLHDGPPFANGDIHLGHALNKILKDIVVRHRTMKGFDSPYVPGWDCHGLPIEYQVMKDTKDSKLPPGEIRRKCADYAKKFIDIQRGQFKRLGISGDWENPYITMDPAYEADILRVFAGMVGKGLVYQSLRPVFWCTDCRTALAEAEVEYQNRNDTSVYVKFEVDTDEGRQALNMQLLRGKKVGSSPDSLDKIYLVIWTTTPWTLPANLAVAASPELSYCFVKSKNAYYLVAESKVADLQKFIGSVEIVRTVPGKQLEGIIYKHPFIERKGQLYLGDFVTAETGTGLVHIAPGHGYDDYVLGQKNKLDILSPVDDRGCFTADCLVPELTGQYVFKANAIVTEILRAKGVLVADEPYQHDYPYCWRSKTPIVFRSVKQWFIKVDAFRDDALKAIDTVEWIPDWGKTRIRGSVESRHDWCISRQRSWGVPIPVFYKADGTPVLEEKIVRGFADIVEKEGTNAWFDASGSDMAKRLGLDPGLRKGSDTLDVWIDSGSSFKAVTQKRGWFPADLYLEGSDQHRGWFQSSLLVSCALEKKAPYKSVLTHGFVVDGEGKKMSKSVGNAVSPQDVVGQLGADVLRLWAASSITTDDIRVSKDIFERLSDSYRKFRNTFKYLLGNLNGFNPETGRMPFEKMAEVDRWALSATARLVEEAGASYDSYQFHRFYQQIYNFCVREMSAFYFDVLKDRLYADPRGSDSGRSARTALFEIFRAVTRLLAPVLAFTADEAWSRLEFPGRKPSVHLEDWPSGTEKWRDRALEEKWERYFGLREKVMKALEEKREKKEIGNSLEAEVELSIPDAAQFKFFEKEAAVLETVYLVSKVAVKHEPGLSETAVAVSPARGKKCARCWNYREEVGNDREYPAICRRCRDVVKGTAKV